MRHIWTEAADVHIWTCYGLFRDNQFAVNGCDLRITENFKPNVCLIFQSFWLIQSLKKGNRKKELKDDLREKCAGRAIYGRTPTPSWDDCSVWKYKQRNRWDEIRPSANEFSIVANFWEKGWTVCSYLMAPPTEVNVVMVVLGKVDHRSLVFGLLQPSLQLSWLWKIFWYVS